MIKNRFDNQVTISQLIDIAWDSQLECVEVLVNGEPVQSPLFNHKWEIKDEVDFCNSIYLINNVDTIDSKERSETIEAFKQVGRLHKPKEIEIEDKYGKTKIWARS